MLRMLIIILGLSLLNCQNQSINPHFSGVYNIEISSQNEVRTGSIQFNQNGTGQLYFPSQSSSRLLPEEAHANFNWKIINNTLKIIRLDNQFTLRYTIESINDESVSLAYLDNVKVGFYRN